MKKINKVIAMLICIAMLFSMCSLIGYAFENEEEFSIEDYTWDDIMTMSNSEFRELLTNFERVYDPFDTYETDPITAIYDENDNSNSVQPRWTSGNEELTETGSHELITARACGILLDDKGFWGANESGSILIGLTISLASILPDTEWSLGILNGFVGHFYNPYTQKSWNGSTTNTAKTNTKDNYENACDEYNSNGISEEFVKSVGKMLHYIQDACEPHHASNITALELKGAHTFFESYVDERINSYIDSFTTISDESYYAGSNMTVEELVHRAALLAYDDANYVCNIDNTTRWDEVANRTTRNAVAYSAVILYKLSLELDIPLTE